MYLLVKLCHLMKGRRRNVRKLVGGDEEVAAIQYEITFHVAHAQKPKFLH
jgi:hypothetical protein